MKDRPLLDLSDLAPEIRARFQKQYGLKARRTRSMTMHEVRSHAIRVVAEIADLTPAERKRVLRQAAKLNDV